MSSSQTTTDPSISHNANNGGAATSAGAQASALVNADGTPVQSGGLDQAQILSLLRHLPGVFNKLVEQGQLKEDAAAALSNLSQPQFSVPPPPLGPVHPFHHHAPPPLQHVPHGLGDPGPSSHPRGPPNMGGAPVPISTEHLEMDGGGGASTDEEGAGMSQGGGGATGTPTTGRSSRGKNATMSQDEWARQRKDNHKEVERRRRGNINEGINELGRIVPNGTGEKAKGAILSRAVQYIHHLKENEARNIEKWTLEKLLMDQAMGDLQSQLEDVKGMYAHEKQARERAEAELQILKGVQERLGAAGAAALAEEAGRRRTREEEEQQGEEDRDGKRQRME